MVVPVSLAGTFFISYKQNVYSIVPSQLISFPEVGAEQQQYRK